MAETIQHATSPQLKHGQASNSADGFTDGLLGHLLRVSNVPQVDIFIEKPFCNLNLKATPAVTDKKELETENQLARESTADFQLICICRE